MLVGWLFVCYLILLKEYLNVFGLFVIIGNGIVFEIFFLCVIFDLCLFENFKVCYLMVSGIFLLWM